VLVADTKSDDTTERGWLIERGDSEESRPRYWAGPGNWWTYDSLQAVRFARAADAHRVVKLLTTDGPAYRVAEHVWGLAR
jgi:hypothetical protein